MDEIQDINQAQFHLIQILGQYAEVFAVGDPQQTIYSWRRLSSQMNLVPNR